MAKTDYQSIDEYIATFPDNVQKRLQAIRQTIHTAIPEATEVISYQIPCFNQNGPVIYFSAYQNHIGIAAPPPTMDVFKNDLTSYKSSKSTFQIPHDEPLPTALITKIAQYRAQENAKRVAAKGK